MLSFDAHFCLAAEKLFVLPGDAAVKWLPAPKTLVPGIQIARITGDPDVAGPFVLRLKFPANSFVAPHHHATAESVTVLSGALFHATGDSFDKSRGEEVKAGGFFFLPEKMSHYLWTTTETIIQVEGVGPFGVEYASPADDPSKHE
ncbi:MAG: cupin [Methylocystis sp.]|nr:MAG: cupin [Methylocystis sp.]